MPRATVKFYAVRSGRHGPQIYDSLVKVRTRVTSDHYKQKLTSTLAV